MIRYLIFVCFILLSIISTAQFANKADHAFKNGAYYKAIELYKKAYSKANSIEEKAEFIYKVAQCYRLNTNEKQAEVWYRKAIKAKYPDPLKHFYLAEALKKQQRYEEAIKQYKKYKEKAPNDSRAKDGIKSCELAKKWGEESSDYVINNERLINSESRDYGPTYYGDGPNKIIFTSNRKSATGDEVDSKTGANFEDLFRSERDAKGKWSVPEPLNDKVNSPVNEGGSVTNQDRTKLYFTRCRVKEDKSMGCEIYMSKKKDDEWGKAERLKLRKEGDDSSVVGHPALGFEDKVLVFASDMKGGKGGKDLWMSISTDGKWGDPQHLGSEINTSEHEMYPFIRNDGTLYFSSNGHLGMGGLDIFKAENQGDNTPKGVDWGNPKNIKHPINSTAHDFGIIFEKEEERGFFSSDRSGGKGQDDIYNFRKPPVICRLITKVYNKKTDGPVPNAKVTVNGTDGSSYEVRTNEKGKYVFDEKDNGERYIKLDNNYTIEVKKDRFLVAKDQISTMDVEESSVFVKEFYIQPYSDTTEIQFPEVRYPYDKAELQVIEDSVNSKDSLDYLYNLLVRNPTIVIELQAHTDARGGDSYNKKLSKRRAKSCVEYLVSKGIPRERLKPKGMGEDHPKIPLSEIKKMETESEREKAHQQNRRTVFVVVRDDYVPKDKGGSDDGSSTSGGN
ncbi:MAG: OmpA family protein [Flavobacteriales bacterium]